MKKIKIIDLLNMVYEAKAPKKILYKHCEYKFEKTNNDYTNSDSEFLFEYLFSYEAHALSFEVEVLEENEKPEEIELFEFLKIENEDHCNLKKKCNELAKAVNYLLKKVEENEKNK